MIVTIKALLRRNKRFFLYASWASVTIALLFLLPYWGLQSYCRAPPTIYVRSLPLQGGADQWTERAYYREYEPNRVSIPYQPYWGVGVQPVAEAEDKKDKNREAWKEEKDWRHTFLCDIKITDLIIADFTILLAVFTAFLWSSTEKLWLAGEGQRIHARRALIAQIGSTKRTLNLADASGKTAMRAAVATEESVKEMQSTAERQLRAYLGIDGALFEQIEDPNIRGGTRMTGYILMVIKNFGVTPAKDIVIKTHKAIKPASAAQGVLPITVQATTHPRSSLPPGKGQTLRLQLVTTDLRPENWKNWGKNDQKAYLWGIINYTDAFEQYRTLKFQMFADFDGPTVFGFCEHGNDSD